MIHLGHMGQIDAVVLIVVHQAARRGNDDLAAGFELALLLVLAVCGVAVALLLEPLGQLRDFWEEASAWGQLPEQLFQPLLKTVCIALICRTGSDLCRDAGEGALASVLETAGAVAAIVVSLPLFRAVWDLLESLL